MSAEELRDRRDHWVAYGYAIAVVGTTGLAAALIPVRDEVQTATVALILVLSVLLAAATGGRGPAWLAALLAFLSLDLFHTTPYLRLKMDQIEEVEIAVVFAGIALLAGEIAVRALEARERVLTTEFREARVGRVLSASAAGVGREQLIRMVEHELKDGLQLDLVRYEAEPYTHCDYNINRSGRLYHRADPLDGVRRRFPATEPIGIDVTSGGVDLGQLVLFADRARGVSEEELVLAAHLAGLLAGLLHEAR